MLAFGIDAPAGRLVDFAKQIHDNEAIRVTVVFDGKDGSIDRPTPEASFSVIYAPADLSADGVIEQLVAQSKNPEDTTVVTQDFSIAQLVRAAHSFVIDAQAFRNWVDRSGVRQDAYMRKLKATKLDNHIDLENRPLI